MLAYPVSDKPIDYKSVVYMQPKLDGVRCLIQYEKTGPNFMDKGKVVAYSRNDKKWKNINHILEELTPFSTNTQMLYSTVSCIIIILKTILSL